MLKISDKRLFTVWFWFGVPLLLGGLGIAFLNSWLLGLLTLLLLVGWVWHLADSACSRCSSYGTTECGIQGRIVLLIWKKRSVTGASQWRLRLQYYLDLAMMVYMNAVYTLFLPLLPVVIVWSIGAWFIVYGPSRYHGLLFKLRGPRPPERERLLSLPVLQAPSPSNSPPTSAS